MPLLLDQKDELHGKNKLIVIKHCPEISRHWVDIGMNQTCSKKNFELFSTKPSEFAQFASLCYFGLSAHAQCTQ